MRKSRPEKEIKGVPEDDWETDHGPNGNPGVCLGVLHHSRGLVRNRRRATIVFILGFPRVRKSRMLIVWRCC